MIRETLNLAKRQESFEFLNGCLYMEGEIWMHPLFLDLFANCTSGKFGRTKRRVQYTEGSLIFEILIVVLVSLFVAFIFRDIRDFLTGDQKMGSNKETSGYHQIARHCHLVSLCAFKKSAIIAAVWRFFQVGKYIVQSFHPTGRSFQFMILSEKNYFLPSQK